MDQLRKHPRHFARGIAHERAVIRIVERRRQCPPKAFFKPHLALVALARPHRISAVIDGRISEHVEEQPVDLVALERLGENLDPMLAVIRAVDARGIEPVEHVRPAVRAQKEPFRMCVVNRLFRLAQVEPADDADLSRMRLLQDFAKQVPPRRKELARIVKLHVRGILCDDPAHVAQKDVRRILRDLLDQPLGIDGGIALAKIRLKKSNRLVHPPPRGFLRGGGHRVHDERKSGESGKHSRAFRSRVRHGFPLSRTEHRYVIHGFPQGFRILPCRRSMRVNACGTTQISQASTGITEKCRDLRFDDTRRCFGKGWFYGCSSTEV